jgi:hypothetical protein
MEYENSFTLQILTDHCRFIQMTVSAKHPDVFAVAKDLEERGNALWLQSLKRVNVSKNLQEYILTVKTFKESLLSQLLQDKLAIGLPPTFFNHMLDELQDRLDHVNYYLQNGTVLEKDFLELHHLWLKDAEGHADALYCNVDMVEHQVRERAKKFRKSFDHLWNRNIEEMKYVDNTSSSEVRPSIVNLNDLASKEMGAFVDLLQELKDLKVSHSLLGQIPVLMIDHMIREEFYYLNKLGYETGDVIRTPEELQKLLS